MSYSGALGGAERILLDVLPSAGDRALLACPPGLLADGARAAGAAVEPIRSRSLELRRSLADRLAAPRSIVGLAREVGGVVRRRRPEIVVAWNMRTLLACAPALGRNTILIFAHNDLLPGPVIARLIRAAARRAHTVVCLSEAIAADLGTSKTVVVAPAGVDLNRFAPAAGASGYAVLSLGAIEPWKRPELALEVAARLPEITLRLAGEPIGAAGTALRDRLERRAAEPDLRGRVELCGRVEDPAAALRDAAALLHCAESEPYGLALVEALACGVPVVAPAAAGPLEIVGDAGALYSPRDAAGAAAALRRVLEPGERARLSAAARTRAVERFDVELTRDRWRELLAMAAAG